MEYVRRDRTPTASPSRVGPLIAWLRRYALSRLDTVRLNRLRLTPSLVADLGNQGILGAPFPASAGGLELPRRDVLALLEQIAAIDVGLAAFVVLHYTSSAPFASFARPVVRDAYLPDLARGRILASFALTEPAAGSNPRAMRTTVHRSGEARLRICGQKTWIGNAEWATVFTCFARHEEHGHRISALAVPRDAAGLTVEPEIETLGLRTTVQNSVRFDDVEVPEDHVVGEAGCGLDVAESVLSFGRLATGAIALGGMKRCAQIMARFTERRMVSTGRLADNHVARERLAGVHGAIAAVSALVERILADEAEGHAPPPEAYMALKVAGAELLFRTADDTLQILGSRGYAETNGVAAVFRDARFLRIGEGPSETLLTQIGASVAHAEPGVRAFVTRLGGRAAEEHLHGLARSVLRQAGPREAEGAYERLGQLAMWHVLASAMEGAAATDAVAARWVQQNLADVTQRALRPHDGAGFDRAVWDRAMAEYDACIGSLDDSWPIPEATRDPYLRRQFVPDPPEPRSRRRPIHSPTDGGPTSATRDRDVSPPAEGAQGIDGFAGRTTDPSYHAHTIHELIEAQVDRAPSQIAIATPGERLTYAELEARANRLASALRARGVGDADMVAVHTSRSAALVVAALGVLKAGASFVILNVDHPKPRRAFILAETGAKAVVVDRPTKGALPPTNAPLLLIDGADGDLGGAEPSRPAPRGAPDDVAYVMFTSGSTGSPKGVLLPHRAVVNQMLARRDELGLGPDDRVLQAAAPNFDIAAWEILGPLVFGGTVVLSGEAGFSWDASALRRAIDDHRITVLQIVPSQLALLLDELKGGAGASLRLVISGGERLPKPLQERFFASAARGLHNYYGMTEGAIDACFWRCSPDDPSPSAPIGRACTNRRVYVLDEAMRPTPIGVPGELYVGGVGLARGYLGNPDLTQQRFLPDPFSSDPAARVYRTGDRARFRSDGALEFLGRVDRQIKVRGVRIEPDEIEITLARHPQVESCAVALRPARQGDPRLVAYLVVRGEPRPMSRDLRAFVREHLPAEMVPSAFVVLDSLPKTASGKVDAASLPEVDGSAFEDAGLEEREPLGGAETDLQSALSAVWSEALGVRVDELSADFFQLGGHSLLAVQVLSRIRERFGVEVSIRDFFEAPTLRALAARVEEGQRAEAPRARLSFPQESLWFLHQLGDEGAYNELEGIRIRGPLATDALRQALRAIVERHEILRTAIVSNGGSPLSVVLPLAHVPILDLRRMREEDLHRHAQEEAIRPFDVERGPLFRMQLVCLGPEDHALLVTIHHLAGDGWSLGLIGRELQALYAALVSSGRAALPALAAQYRGYATWQHENLSGPQLDRQLAYWKKKLDGLPPVLELPLDGARPAVQRFCGAAEPFQIGVEASAALRALGRRLRATPYMTALAVLMILLHRYSRMDDVAVGSPFANRGLRQFEDLVGFFANTLVLRGDFSADPRVEELIAAVRETTLEAHEHADVPFEKIVEALRPERNLGHNPIFQIMFSWQSGSTLADIELPGCQVEALPVVAQRAKFDVNIIVWDDPDSGLRGRWEYNTSVLRKETVARMIAHYRRLIDQAARFPDRRASELDMLGDDERREMLTLWAARESPRPEACLHELFESCAARDPEAIAVVMGREALTYGELDRRATRLARYLAACGVGPERLVGMFLERSLDMIVAVLGILKAGGAYVPLDPVYPTARLRLILDDAGVDVVLTQESLLAALPETTAHVVCLDRDHAEIDGQTSALAQATPSNAAYVIYTSGSTGVPKGVVVTHANVVRLFQSTRAWFQLRSSDVWPLFHSYAFDVSVWEIWGALLHGGRLVVVPYLVSRSPDDFYRLLVDEKITVLNQTPSAFQQLSRAEEKLGVDPGLALRLVIFAGEKLDFNTLGPWFNRHGDRTPQLVNMYGITETTVHVTYRPLTRADVTAGRGSLIGQPIPDLDLRVLDEKQRLVPMGVPGELYVGGAGVARGYLRRPDLDAYRFIRDPFDPAGERRLYRSGDIVRPLPDGDLAYVGRIDHQVQLRGFRVELGEIEAALTSHPEIAEAFAMIRPDTHGDDVIIAYVVPRRGASTPTNALRRHVQDRVPSYMVPAFLVALPALPLTPNGKVDRKALPAPAGGREGVKQPLLAPRSSVEAALAEVWSEVLRVSPIGVRDNFFELGGHSLLAVRLVSHLEVRLRQKVTVAALFQNPTIERLAAALAVGYGSGAWSPLVRLREGSTSAFYVVPGSGGMVAAFHALACSIQTGQAIVALERRGLDGASPPDETVEAIAAQALTALRREQPSGPYFLGGHSFGAYVALEMARALARAGEPVALLSVIDMPAPDLAPLARQDDDARVIDTLLGMVTDLCGGPIGLSRAELLGLSLDDQIDRLRGEMVRRDLLPTSATIDAVRMIVRVLRADESALARYAPEAHPVTFPIALIRTARPWFDADAGSEGPGDPAWGWKAITTAPVTVTEVPGDHGTMLAPPHVEALAAALEAAIAAANRR